MSDSSLVQNTSNYKAFEAYLSRYRYARVPLNNVSSSSVPLSLNANTLMEWKIPSKTVFNLAKSYISYSYAIPQQGVAQYGVAFEDGQDLCQWAYFGDGGGLGIMDLNYVDRYVKVVRPIRTPTTEYLGNDLANGMYPCNQLNTSNLQPFSMDGTTTGTMNASTTSYLEPQYLRIAPAVNADLVINRTLPLSAFKDTFIGMDKNQIFGRDMYLRMTTQYGARLGFSCTNPARPSATASTLTVSPAQYSNVFLFLALEENKKVMDSLTAALMSGSIRMLIPYQYTYRYNGSGGASNMSITLTRQFGHKLKRLLYAPFNGVNSEQGCYAFDHSNVNGTKISQFQSSLDSRPLSDYQLQCFNPNLAVNPGAIWTYATNAAGASAQSDDYREAKKFLVGSAIPSQGAYQANWFYCDSWGLQDMVKNMNQLVPDENVDDGFNLLDSDHVYTLQLTTPYISAGASNTANQIVHYLFASFVRTLNITADGISFS